MIMIWQCSISLERPAGELSKVIKVAKLENKALVFFMIIMTITLKFCKKCSYYFYRFNFVISS